MSALEHRLFTNDNYGSGFDWEANATALLMDYACDIWDLNTNGVLSQMINLDCCDDAPVRNPVDGRIVFHNLHPLIGMNPSNSIAGLYVANAGSSGRHTNYFQRAERVVARVVAGWR